VGPCRDDAELVKKGEALCKRLDIEALLITRSDKGMSLLRSNAAAIHLPTLAREVFDVTGAGDTVIAALATALAAGSEWPDAMHISNLAAGIVVGKLGTATASPSELRRALYAQTQSNRSVLDQDMLAQAVADAHAHGEKIVMTNGCFDILHAGHVGYLDAARKLGDRLIVAVNTDDSVTRLKGADRPINPLEHRMQVLAGLQCVDWVVPFAEDTPEQLICTLLPDVLVKGGDYTVEQIAGAGCVQQNGGEVVVLDFQEGCSTSRIVDAIRKQASDTI
jgi:D-beta-D-heptose 7-phosphate kinase/D-beta-D-heptose 1-phosphate adenosyltransferase